LLEPVSTLGGGLLLLILLGVAWRLRRRAPLVTLGILWFFIAHALTSNVVSLDLVFEHRNYLATFGILLALAEGSRLLSIVLDRRQLLIGVAACLLTGYAVLALIRSATWGDRMTFALYHVDMNPRSARAGLELALGYLGRADVRKGLPFLVQARNEMERIAKLPKSRTIADRGLIVLAARLEEPVPHEYWQRLLQKVRTRSLNHSDHDAIYELVELRQQGLELSDLYLWRLHDVLCERDDVPYEIHLAFGRYAQGTLDDPGRATSAFRRALELSSGHPGRQREVRESLGRDGFSMVDGVGACSIGAPEESAAGGLDR
jgi:hypothetical protein